MGAPAEASHPPFNPRRILPIVACISGLGIASATIYVPSLPVIVRDLATTVGLVQLTLTAFFFGNVVGQLGAGPLSDRYGRRIVALTGVALWAATSLACAVADHIGLLFALRVLQGIGVAAGMVVARAIVRDLFDRERAARAASLISMSVGIAPVLGPILGGYIEVFLGWRWAFGMVTVAALLLWLWAAQGLPETHLNRAVRPNLLRSIASDYARLLRHRGFRAFAAVNIGLFGGMYSFVAAGPILLMQTFGVAPQHYGLLAGAVSAGYFCGSAISSRLTVRLGLERMIDVAMLCLLVSGLLLLGTALFGWSNVASTVTLMFLWAVGMGLGVPNSNVGAVSIHPEIAGTAAALLGALQITAGTLGTVLVFLLPAGSALALGGQLAAIALGSTAGWFALRRFAAGRRGG